MADIKTTVDGMPKKDVVVAAPAVVEPSPPPGITAAKITTIAKEMVQPWKYGTHLQQYAERHGVSMKIVREIHKAVTNRLAELTAEVE